MYAFYLWPIATSGPEHIHSWLQNIAIRFFIIINNSYSAIVTGRFMVGVVMGEFRVGILMGLDKGGEGCGVFMTYEDMMIELPTQEMSAVLHWRSWTSSPSTGSVFDTYPEFRSRKQVIHLLKCCSRQLFPYTDMPNWYLTYVPGCRI